MTTLVYRSGVLAADTRSTSGRGIINPGTTTKVFCLSDGRLAGYTGTLAEAQAYIRWLDGGSEADAPALDDSTVVVVSQDGAVTIHEGGSWYPAEGSDFHAWGTGAAPALGALFVGATAEQAVEAAMSVDPDSGGSVQSVSL